MNETVNSGVSVIASGDDVRCLSYEEKLSQDLSWAMHEGSRHFDEKSAVHETLHRVCQRLSALKIPYAVVGGMALFKYGYRRFTEDVDLLVTRESLKIIHKELDGLGYRQPFTGSKHLRDTEHQVKIEFLVTGEYPGDGKPKEVAFPDPSDVTVDDNNIRYLKLQTLIELKIASGMTGQDRLKDLVDVQELIRILALPQNYGQQLANYVKPKFDELWHAVNGRTLRYLTLWRNKFLTIDATSFDEMIDKLGGAVELLKQMRDDGVQFDREGSTGDDYIHLYTTDPEIARKYDMHDEREFFGTDLDVESDNEAK